MPAAEPPAAEPPAAEPPAAVPPAAVPPEGASLAESYAIPLDELEGSARVPFDEQVLEEDVGVEALEDDGAGHLPGGLRPYGV